MAGKRRTANYSSLETPLENSPYGVINAHKPTACQGHTCTLHNRSAHHMRSWPQVWRVDVRVMERTCPHGIGHPDPDDINKNSRHGCDGCCVPPRPHEIIEDPQKELLAFLQRRVGLLEAKAASGDRYWQGMHEAYQEMLAHLH